MGEVPESHPRYTSLMARKRMTAAAAAGMLADSALIAHGRGEAFDYLLGEQTCEAGLQAIRESAARLLCAENPVICINGNAAALAAEKLVSCAAALQCPIEINIYYRTEGRMKAIYSHLADCKKSLSESPPPDGWDPKRDWISDISNVMILGDAPDGEIPNLSGPRAACQRNGILAADVLLVPLEDGDRCEALVAMGKDVCVIDLNPMSRTAGSATVCIVDELQRATTHLLSEILTGEAVPDKKWDSESNRANTLAVMLSSLQRLDA